MNLSVESLVLREIVPTFGTASGPAMARPARLAHHGGAAGDPCCLLLAALGAPPWLVAVDLYTALVPCAAVIYTALALGKTGKRAATSRHHFT